MNRKTVAHLVCAADFVLSVGRVGADVFYAAPDGQGAGSSWADAADLKTAYDAAAQAGGGEVWLKKGTHILAETVALASGVVVRGGFVGTETSADESDPEANVTMISGDALQDDVWYPDATTTSSKFVSLYDGEGGLVAVNPNQANLYWSAGAADSAKTADNLAHGFTNAIAAVSGAAFHGLTFASFQNAAVSVTHDVFESYLFSNCRFVACNNRRSTLASLYLSGTKGVVSNCTFEGCCRAVSFLGGTNTLSRCTVRKCYAGSSISELRNACVTTSGKAVLTTFTDCLFEWNYGDNTSSYSTALDIRIDATASTGGRANLTHCVFRNGRMKGNVYAPLVHASGALRISHCIFTNNVNTMSGQQGAGALTSGSDVLMSGCYIADNIVTNSSGNYATGALSFPGGQYDVQVSDTTIERNTVIVNGSGPCGTLLTGSLHLKCVFANCVVADNVVAATASGSGRAADFCNNQASCNNSHTVFFNSILSGSGPSGQPFFSAVAGAVPRLCVVNSAFANYPAQTIGSDVATLELDNAVTNALGEFVVPDGVAPLLRPKAVIGPDGVPARGVRPGSPYAKSARPFWVGGGFWWYPDSPSPNSTVTKATHYNFNISRSNAAGKNYGYVDFSAPLPNDAIGRARDRSGFPLGPLQIESPATVFYIR